MNTWRRKPQASRSPADIASYCFDRERSGTTATAGNLIDITVDGREIKAIAQSSKQAFTYVLDRVTGEPVWPIEERPVPQSDVPGERTSPTQPHPTRPAPFDLVREGLAGCLEPYDLENTKVAHRASYPITSNWKLALENYTECYHCAPAHPEYSKGHSLAHPDSKTEHLWREVMARAGACGLSDKTVNQFYLEAPEFGADYAFDRYPLIGDHLTGSKDGQPLAPLLGTINEYDGGATDLQVGPVTFALMYCDHIVIYRFTPVSLDKSECDITWLVNGDAVEGQTTGIVEGKSEVVFCRVGCLKSCQTLVVMCTE